MRNQIDFQQPPEELFLNPAQDRGLYLLKPAEFFWRERQPGRIYGFAASAFGEVTEKINSVLNVTRRHKVFRNAVEFNTVPVLAQQLTARKAYLQVEGKYLLNGASGRILLNRYCWENEERFQDPEEQLVSYFQRCQRQNENGTIPIWQERLPPDIPFVIEGGNTFNYHHFVTETLPKLALIHEMRFSGRVHIHIPKAPDHIQQRALVMIQALFPEIADRLIFEHRARKYDRALIAFDFLSAYHHFPAKLIGDLSHLAPSDAAWRGPDAYRASQAVLGMNSASHSLHLIRDRALQAIRGQDFSYLPKRFLVVQGDGSGSPQRIAGELELYEMLREFGFDYVILDRLKPLEQIAIMANSEVVISPRTGGLSNMIFVPKEAYLLEIGTLQSAISSWGSYWPLAHVAQCRYVSFFADYDKRNQLENPAVYSVHAAQAVLSSKGLAELMSFVVTILGMVPDLPSAASLQPLVEKLIAMQEFEKAHAVLEKHANLVPGNLVLCLAKADCHRYRNEPNHEILALHMAYESNLLRWQTLVRLIWCAKRNNMPEVVSWALACLRHDFPKRFSVLCESRTWMRQLS